MHRDLIDDATCAQSSRGIRTANSEVRTIARYVLRNRTERTLGIWNHVRRLAIRYD